MDVISDENIGDTLRNVDHPNLARLLDSQVRSESTPGQHEHVEPRGQAKRTLTVKGTEARRGIGWIGSRESRIHRTACPDYIPYKQCESHDRRDKHRSIGAQQKLRH
jgi:hypothetical protein